MIVLPFKVRLRPFAPPYFLIRYLHYYGPADYPCVIFLALPFRCRPSPITTWQNILPCRAVLPYQYDCLNAALRTPLYSAGLGFPGPFLTDSMAAITPSPIATRQKCVR